MERGNKENFSKIAHKKPSFERPKRILAEMALSSKLYALKDQRLGKILAQKADPKVPEWLSYGNSRKVTQKPHFVKKCKGRTKENVSKLPKK